MYRATFLDAKKALGRVAEGLMFIVKKQQALE